MFKGLKFGFGLVIGAVCAVALVALLALNPMAVLGGVLGGVGILIAAILLLVGLVAITRYMSELPIEVHRIIAGGLLLAMGWALIHGSVLGSILPPGMDTPVLRISVKAFGWFSLVGGSVVLLGSTLLPLILPLLPDSWNTGEVMAFTEADRVKDGQMEALETWGRSNASVELRTWRMGPYQVVALKGAMRLIESRPQLG
jgi:hypothetical protein